MEYLGYIATVLVLLSFTRKKIEQLRVLNSIGAILFVIYGIGIHSFPVVLTNALIFLINMSKLSGHKTTKYSSFEDRINNKEFNKNGREDKE
jgi:hypothetical protein